METATATRRVADSSRSIGRQTLLVLGATGTYAVACTDQGAGPPVVLLHCNASSRHQWRGLVADLSRHYRVLAADLFGHGDSRLPGLPATFTVADEVAMVAALIEHAGEAVHLVGHSYGGAIALKVALALQRDVRSLTLIEPASFELLRHAGETEAWDEIRLVAERHVELIRQGEPGRAADVFMGYWIGLPAWQATPPERRRAVCSTMPAIARAWEIILGERTGLGGYARLEMPALLMQGAETRSPCARVMDLLGAAFPQSTRTTIAGAGHMAPITHAEPVNAAIATHLERNRPAGTTPWRGVETGEATRAVDCA